MTALSIHRVRDFSETLSPADSLPAWVHSLVNNIGLFKAHALTRCNTHSMWFFCDLIGSRYAEKHCPSHWTDSSNDLRNDCLAAAADIRQTLIDAAPIGVDVTTITVGGEATSYIKYPTSAATRNGQVVYLEEVEYKQDTMKMALGFIYRDADGKESWYVVEGWPTL